MNRQSPKALNDTLISKARHEDLIIELSTAIQYYEEQIKQCKAQRAKVEESLKAVAEDIRKKREVSSKC